MLKHVFYNAKIVKDGQSFIHRFVPAPVSATCMMKRCCMELSIFTVCLIHIKCCAVICLGFAQEESSVVPVTVSAGVQF